MNHLFRDHLTPEIYLNKRIIISEKNLTNADFIIKELSKKFTVSMFSCYSKNKFNIKNFVSVFCEDYPQNIEKLQNEFINNEIYKSDKILIIDDYFSYKHILNNNIENNYNSIFFICRSNSFDVKYGYDADFIIEIDNLESGMCEELDGRIFMYGREGVIFEGKYKVGNDDVFYVK